MARGNMFLGQVRGKIGDVIIKRSASSESVIQVRPSSYTRKKATYSQCRAQAIAVTSAKIYSVFQNVIAESWQKIIQLNKVHSQFLKKANTRQKKFDVQDRKNKLPFAESMARYVPKNSSPVVPADIQVANGTLINNFKLYEDECGIRLPNDNPEINLEDYLAKNYISQGMIITFCIINVGDTLATIVDNKKEPGYTSYQSTAFYRQFRVDMPSTYERHRPISVAQWLDCLKPFYGDDSAPLLQQRVVDTITLSSFTKAISTRAWRGAGAIAVIVKSPRRNTNTTSFFHLINRQCFGIDNRAVKASYAYEWDALQMG